MGKLNKKLVWATLGLCGVGATLLTSLRNNQINSGEVGLEAPIEEDISGPFGLARVPQPYDEEFPIKSGGYEPSRLPTTYKPTMPDSSFSLDELLEDLELHGELVDFYPKNRLKSPQFVLGYFSGGNWCPNCVYLDKLGLTGAVKEEINTHYADKVVLAKFVDPGPGPKKAPKVFETIKAVPELIFYRVSNGKLFPIGAVDPRDWSLAIEKTLALMKDGVQGNLKPFELNNENFSHYGLGFPATLDMKDPYPYDDLIAVLEAMARFGPIVKYSEKNDEFVVSLNLDNPAHFWFAFAYDRSLNSGGTNRGVLNDIRSQIWDFSISEQDRNPYYAKIGRWIDNTQKRVLGVGQERQDHYEMHLFFQTRFHNYTNGCFPPFIADRYNSAVTYGRDVFHGRIDEVHYIPEITSQEFQEAVRRYAEKNGLNIVEKHLPTLEELLEMNLGNSDAAEKAVGNLAAAKTHLSETFSILSSYGVDFVDPWYPAGPIFDVLGGVQSAVILRGGPSDNPMKTIHSTVGSTVVEHEYNLLEVFAHIARDFPNEEWRDNMFLYLPHTNTQFGFCIPPFVSARAISDEFAHWNYGSAIIVYTPCSLQPGITKLPPTKFVYYGHEKNQWTTVLDRLKK